MDERSLRRQIRRITVIVALVSAGILAAGAVASYYLRNILETALTEHMESEAEQYKINIQRQMDADFQTLDTLASFLQYSKMSTDAFVQGFLLSKENNEFEHMGFFGKGNTDINVTIDSDIMKDVSLDMMNDEVQEVVRQAWEGQSGVSRIYEVDGVDMFTYAVPVYRGEEPVGALIAAVGTGAFEKVLQDHSILGGEGYLHMISDSGKLLVRAKDRVVREELETIYDNGYFMPEEQEKIEEAMAAGETCFSEFTYEGVTYQVFLDPINVNGWYLFCVQTAQGVSSTIYHLMTNTRIMTMVVLFLILVVIAYGYGLIYQGNKRLIRTIYYDPLTGAYNMVRFEYNVTPVIQSTYNYSLAAMNIRQFKFINEIFGSRTADMLLCYIKKVLVANIQEGEYYCRSSEDMFYLLLRDTERDKIRERLEKMIREISRYGFDIRRDYQIMLYCGVVIGTDVQDEDPSVQKALTHVRFALDTARSSLKKSIWFYDTSLHKSEILENYVESHMNQALENQEFKMYLQPKIDLGTGRVGSAEALVRWIPEEGDMIYPGQFIPIFEKNGFCSNLDLYMVEQVCRQIRVWIDEGTTPVPLSVNQSKLLFYEVDYIDKMKGLLEKYQVPGNLITLEILEGLAMGNIDELNEKILRLKELGFRISMDDFGSGYSSLNTLASLKIDEVKFDREFLLRLQERGMDYDRQVVIMSEIVELTKKLKISTVVEGVETQENEDLIKKLGCGYGQGYYYSRPVSVEEFSEKYVDQ